MPAELKRHSLGYVELLSGEILPSAELAYCTYGELNAAKDNVVLLPHMSSATLEGRMDMGEKVIINIKTFADGHRPPDRVIPAIL